MMKRKGIGFVIILFLPLLQGTRKLDGSAVQYYGFIGCLFSSSICRSDEECVDDGLFGSCQRLGAVRQDLYWYQLSSFQLLELEKILHQLATSGYTWRHLYTQCRVMSALLSFRYGVFLGSDFCDGREPAWIRRHSMQDSGKNDSTDKLIDDLIDMLTAQISTADKEKGGIPLRRMEHEKQEKLSSVPRLALDKNSDDRLGRFLKHLSESDLKALKEFLIEDEEDKPSYGDGDEEVKNSSEKVKIPLVDDGDDTAVVKKADPSGTGTVTHVVVRYDPRGEPSTEGDKNSATKTVSQGYSEENEISFNPDSLWTSSSVREVVDHESNIVGTKIPSYKIVPLDGLEEVSDISTSVSSPSSAEFNDSLVMSQMASSTEADPAFMIPLYILCGVLIVVVIAAVVLVIMRHNSHIREKLAMSTKDDCMKEDACLITDDYQDLCREDMRLKLEERKPCPSYSSVFESPSTVESAKTLQRSNALPWSEDPVASDMDISTGHLILSYMEDHLKNKNKLDKDWDQLCSYVAEPGSIVVGLEPSNRRKNRFEDILPYEHTRFHLNPAANVTGSDYINANTITDHDPRCPAYIATQGPLPHTVSDFWQMVWEQGSTTIVCLTRLVEKDTSFCYRYWPLDGSDLYHMYEVQLILERDSPCGDYVVRSFCLRNVETNESRTVTQFHYLSWPYLGVPISVKTLMEFRRKVNHSYHGRFCPIIVHCSDGAGQTGTYCLIDMVLNRLHKGAKEMDIAATLEHLRDQRIHMVRTKEQFEFCLTAIAYEVEGILRITSAK